MIISSKILIWNLTQSDCILNLEVKRSSQFFILFRTLKISWQSRLNSETILSNTQIHVYNEYHLMNSNLHFYRNLKLNLWWKVTCNSKRNGKFLQSSKRLAMEHLWSDSRYVSTPQVICFFLQRRIKLPWQHWHLTVALIKA